MVNETRRIIIKKGTSIATIPASSDHTDGTWLSTDLYIGEFYMNTTNGKIYTRTATGIEEIIYDVADFEVFKSGNYTKFSENLKRKILAFWKVENQVEDNNLYDILYGIGSVEEDMKDAINEGEVWPKPLMHEEIYMLPE